MYGSVICASPREREPIMAEILIENEASLVKTIRESEEAYGDFQKNRLKDKIARESKAWPSVPI